jgi:CRP-like cAMP-binding protein
MEELFKLLNSICPVTEDLREHIEKILKTRKLKEGDHLLKAGQICKNIFFIEKGLLRCYYLIDDAEINNWFMMENDVIISVKSFFAQVPSYEYIQAIEGDATVHYVSYEELYQAYQKYASFCLTGLILTQHYYMSAEDRLYALRMPTATQAYEFLKAQYPKIVGRVSAKYIASFLGISEQHFSKIKPPAEKRNHKSKGSGKKL